MEMCARCHKRPAVVFITKIENGKSTNQGLCIKCAKEMGIPQVSDIMERMGLTDEDLDRMDSEMENMMSMFGMDGDEDGDENALEAAEGESSDDEGRAPAVDFRKLFGNMIPLNPNQGQQGQNQPPKNEPKQKGQNKRKYLDQYCLNLTKRAADGKLDRIIGRDRELERVMQILCRRQKNNPCLIGEPGVGKTAIAEALAQRIVDGNVPYKLRDREVQLVDMTALVAGTQFRGQFEARMKGLIDEVKHIGNVILVIDEVHSLVGAGDAEGSMNAANIIKPALSRGEIQVIGATTLTEYRKYIEKDSALERRFQQVIIEEPSINDTIKILGGIKNYYETFHNINIPDDVVERAVILSERYITDRFLPDKAIDLLDEAAAYLAMHTSELTKREETKAIVAKNEKERDELEAKTKNGSESELEPVYRRLAELKADELKLAGELEELDRVCDNITLTTEELAKVIEIWTGIPASSVTEAEFERVDRLQARLCERIVGQDEAVKAVAQAIKRNRAGVSYKRKPVSFIFAGPTGVGKTELVKTLAGELFDSPETLIRLDMSEFMEKHAVSRIIGSPPGYVGYDDAGQLTEKIRRKPYSVVLFDEIEKAHPDVMNVLLQILDDGRVTDAHGKTVNFENTIIVMTTNAGSNLNLNPTGFVDDIKTFSEDKTQKALSDFLRPEFINRVDEIITFRSLDEKDFGEIAKIMLGDLKKALAEKSIKLVWSDDLPAYIAKQSFSRKFGARNMRRYIQTNIENELANRIIADHSGSIAAASITVSADGNSLEFTCI